MALTLRPRTAGPIPKRRPGSAATEAGPAATTRLFSLHDTLAAGRPLNAVAFARQHELSPRTVKRDLERLRDFHQAPIAWDACARTYRYTAPFDLASGLRLDAAEALAIVLAGRTFAAWGGTPLGRTLTAALEKIAAFAGPALSFPAAELRAVLHQDEAAQNTSEHRHFAALLEHILARRELTVHYQKPSATRAERRTLRPLHLAYLDQRWMLVAAEPGKPAWKNFLLGRIQTLAPTGQTFTPPSVEKLKTHLSGNLGRFTGARDRKVRLRFDATAAPYVKERPWHASQKLTPLPEGGADVTLTLNNLIDVSRRVLSNGRHVEVLAPPELRQTIAAELAALAQAYAPELAAEKNTQKLRGGHPASLATR